MEDGDGYGAAFVEQRLHAAFEDHRVRKSREFFRIAPERVKAALELAAGEEVRIDEARVVETQEDIDALVRAKNRKKVFNFGMIGMPVGTVLVHTHDPNATCAVHDDRNVMFEGEVMSLSKSAGIVLDRLGLSSNVAGTVYWTSEGKTLWALRSEMMGDEE